MILFPFTRPWCTGSAACWAGWSAVCHCAGALAVSWCRICRGVHCWGLRGLPMSGMLRRRLVWAWREKSFSCAGRDSGLSCGDICGAAVDAGSGRESSAIWRCFAPDANAAGAGYWMNALRRMWTGCGGFGPGDGSLPLGEKAALGTVENLQGRRCGSCAPITCWLTRAGGTVLPAPQRWPQLSRARWHGCGARPCAPAAASGGCARWAAVHCSRCTACQPLLSCLSWSSARGMLPFLDGGWTGVMQAGLQGFLLGLPDDSCASRRERARPKRPPAWFPQAALRTATARCTSGFGER